MVGGKRMNEELLPPSVIKEYEKDLRTFRFEDTTTIARTNNEETAKGLIAIGGIELVKQEIKK